jgi:uncharacterized protein (DUF305 family)
METKHQHTQGHRMKQAHEHYARLYVMAGLSFIAMFVLMYAMVDQFDNVFVNLNQVYMAALMAAPMVVIEIALMAMMYPNKKKNAVIVAVSVAVGVLAWILIRQQGAIDNSQFLRSMIPHHAGAILMCEELRADDSEIKDLCAQIIKGQTEEIALMRRKLEQTE